MQATLLQVPHHGSNTSSSLPLIQRVNGKWHSHRHRAITHGDCPCKAKHRYQQQGYRVALIPTSGQITVNFQRKAGGLSSLREQILPRWYHQWFGVPVDNG